MVSHWWDEVERVARPALPGPTAADVCVVGAGYTGLWTSYYLARAAPELRVVVVEQRFAGYGASGRNGGWLVNSITGGRDRYVRTHGAGAAHRLQTALNETVDEVLRVVAAEGIDAGVARGGELTVATNDAQWDRLQVAVAAEQRWDHDTGVELLDADAARARVAVPGLRGAAWQPHAARVQPARLVAGLARAAQARGVEIVEDTTVTALRPGRVETDRGPVTARFVVRATEGFTAGLPGERRTWLPMNSSLIVTAPLPAPVWADIGWEGREVLGDAAHAYVYAQRTADDRIALGGRGVPYRFGSRLPDPVRGGRLARSAVDASWPDRSQRCDGARDGGVATVGAAAAVPRCRRGRGRPGVVRGAGRAPRLGGDRRAGPRDRARVGGRLRRNGRRGGEPRGPHADRPDPRPVDGADRAAVGGPPGAAVGARTAAVAGGARAVRRLPGGGPGRAPRPADDVAAGPDRRRGVRAPLTQICQAAQP